MDWSGTSTVVFSLGTEAPQNHTVWPENMTLTGPIMPVFDAGAIGRPREEHPSNITCGFPGRHNVTFGDAFNQGYVKYRFTLDVVIAGFLCFFGIIGNGISLAVLRRIPGRSTTILLCALAVADIFYLIACMFFQVLKTLHYYVPEINRAMPHFAYVETVVWPFAAMAQTCSVWLVVLVTADRCLGISCPLRAKSMVTTGRVLVAIAVVIVFAVTFNIPTIFDLKVKTYVDPCTNVTRVEAVASDLHRTFHYQLIYKTVLCTILRTTVPFILVVILNLQILLAIRRSRKQSTSESVKTTPNQSPSSALHQLVACVVGVFVVCELPDLTYRILWVVLFFYPSPTIDWNKIMYFAHFTNLMLTVNSSVNFLAYCIMGKKFRRVLLEMCCKVRSDKSYISLSSAKSLSTKTTSSTNVNRIAN